GHGWLHICSDPAVWGAYVAIPCVLGFFVLRRKGEREVTARKDIEELQRTNAELKARFAELEGSEELFRLYIDGTKDYAIYLLDTTGRIVSWNPGAERV